MSSRQAAGKSFHYTGKIYIAPSRLNWPSQVTLSTLYTNGGTTFIGNDDNRDIGFSTAFVKDSKGVLYLITGAPAGSISNRTYCGKVYIVRYDESLQYKEIQLSSTPSAGNAVIFGAAASDGLGIKIAGKDANGSSEARIVITANNIDYTGVVYDLPLDQILQMGTVDLKTAVIAGGFKITSLAASHGLERAAIAALPGGSIIGAPYEAPYGGSYVGRTSMLIGNDWTNPTQIPNLGNNGIILNGVGSNTYSGKAVFLADINGNGLVDAIVCAAGKIYVAFIDAFPVAGASSSNIPQASSSLLSSNTPPSSSVLPSNSAPLKSSSISHSHSISESTSSSKHPTSSSYPESSSSITPILSSSPPASSSRAPYSSAISKSSTFFKSSSSSSTSVIHPSSVDQAANSSSTTPPSIISSGTMPSTSNSLSLISSVANSISKSSGVNSLSNPSSYNSQTEPDHDFPWWWILVGTGIVTICCIPPILFVVCRHNSHKKKHHRKRNWIDEEDPTTDEKDPATDKDDTENTRLLEGYGTFNPFEFLLHRKPTPLANSQLDTELDEMEIEDRLPTTSIIPNIYPVEITEPRELASGACGTVYAANYRGERVAVKVLQGTFVSCAAYGEPYAVQEVENFIREAKMLMKLQHPNIVQLFGFYYDPKPKKSNSAENNDPIKEANTFIVMEYSELGSLSDCLYGKNKDGTDKPHISLSAKQFYNIIYRIAAGIEYLHSLGIIHRDIKSPNILLFRDAQRDIQPKLSDLGTARLTYGRNTDMANIITIENDFAGSPQWVAPEIITAFYNSGNDTKGTAKIQEIYTTKSDVYSFGIVLWEMFSRKEPYENLKNRPDIFRAVMQGTRPTIEPRWNPEFVRLMQACWAPSPDDRPTMGMVLNRLWQIILDAVKIDEAADLPKPSSLMLPDDLFEVKISEKGNSLFLAISISTNQRFKAKELRDIAADYIQSHKDLFRYFIRDMADGNSFAAYLQHVRTDPAFKGDYSTMLAIASSLNQAIIFLTRNNRADPQSKEVVLDDLRSITRNGNNEGFAGDPIFVLRNSVTDHCDGIIVVQGNRSAKEIHASLRRRSHPNYEEQIKKKHLSDAELVNKHSGLFAQAQPELEAAQQRPTHAKSVGADSQQNRENDSRFEIGYHDQIEYNHTSQ